MKVVSSEYSLKLDSAVVSDSAANFRPLTWPPAHDWPVVINAAGDVVSRWGDTVWDLSPWAGKPEIMNFGDEGDRRVKSHLDAENADILRLAMTWLIWGPRGCRKAGTIKNQFTQVRCIVALCSANGISASSLTRFPKVREKIHEVIAASKWKETIGIFHRLYDARDALGFTILDSTALRSLAELTARRRQKI